MIDDKQSNPGKSMKCARFISISFLLILFACGGAAKKGEPAARKDENEDFSSYRAYDHFVKGDLLEQAGDYSAAADEYRKALIFDPGSIEIRRSLSEVYFKQRKFTEAAVIRSEISQRTADDYNFIGDCLRYTDDLKGAVDFYNRSLDLDPKQPVTRSYLAGILYHLGNYGEAEKQYTLAIDYSDDKVASYLELASFYMRVSEKDKAMKAYADALKEKPDDLRPAVGLAGLFVARGDTAKADSIFSSLIQKNRDNVDALNSLIPAFFSTDRIGAAAEASGRIAELLPDDADAQRRYAFLLFGSGHYTKAESAFVVLEGKGMADASILYYHGRIKQFNSEFSAAVELYKQALAQNDTLIDAWVNLAIATDAQKDYQGALGVMQSAYDKMPWDSLTILYYTSLIHSRNEKFDLARDGYLRLLASQPDNVDFRFSLGAAYERLGEFEQAESQFKWVIEKAPDNALALNYLGYM